MKLQRGPDGQLRRSTTTGKLRSAADISVGCCCDDACYCGLDKTHTLPDRIKCTIADVNIPFDQCLTSYVVYLGTEFSSDGFGIKYIDLPINDTFCLVKVPATGLFGRCVWTCDIPCLIKVWQDHNQFCVCDGGYVTPTCPETDITTVTLALSTGWWDGQGAFGSIGLMNTPLIARGIYGPISGITVPPSLGGIFDHTPIPCSGTVTLTNRATYWYSFFGLYDPVYGISYATDPGGSCGGGTGINTLPCPDPSTAIRYGGTITLDTSSGC